MNGMGAHQSKAMQKEEVISSQLKETVEQQASGVGCRMATITCPCGRERGVLSMYQCLYCKVWLCDPCAEAHFGKTVAEYQEQQTNKRTLLGPAK